VAFSSSISKIRQKNIFHGVQVTRHENFYVINIQQVDFFIVKNNSGNPLLHFTVSCYCTG
jgi:hypothetical protein